MAVTGGRRAWIAGLLSGLMPGLGQFYNRQWWKGAGFLIGLMVSDGLLGVTAGAWRLFQAVVHGYTGDVLPEDIHQLLLRSLVPLAIAMWSVIDAVAVARKDTA